MWTLKSICFSWEMTYKCWVFHIYVNQLEGNPIVPWASFFISGQISQSHSIFQACNWLIITTPEKAEQDGPWKTQTNYPTCLIRVRAPAKKNEIQILSF